MTRIYFVRHAEPNLNNHDDESRELSAKGMADRKLVTDFLADKSIDVVLSSPFKRAIDTVKDFADTDYKLSDGEALNEVQKRNINALKQVLKTYENQNVVIGSHGTALSTIINYYQPTFLFAGFERIKGLMPWIVHFEFAGEKCRKIEGINLFEGTKANYITC